MADPTGLLKPARTTPTRPPLDARIRPSAPFTRAAGTVVPVYNGVRSMKHGVRAGPDPWKANTLEWFTQSPPPVNNFDVIPRVRSVEPMKDIRRQVARQTGAGVELGA